MPSFAARTDQTGPFEEIVTRPPLMCIELVSPDDPMSQMQQRIQDYLDFGVPHVLVLDPEIRKAFLWTRDSIREVREPVLLVPNPPLEIPIADLFAQLG